MKPPRSVPIVLAIGLIALPWHIVAYPGPALPGTPVGQRMTDLVNAYNAVC